MRLVVIKDLCSLSWGGGGRNRIDPFFFISAEESILGINFAEQIIVIFCCFFWHFFFNNDHIDRPGSFSNAEKILSLFSKWKK